MRIASIGIFLLFFLCSISNAISSTTMRIPQFSNNKVSVWKTIIYPSKNQALKMHRHDHDRVVVVLSDSLLKVTNEKGKVHYLKFAKNTAYYLKKDVPNELHKDQNMSPYPIKVLVIELK